jgi:hypothetical protein
LHVEKTLKCLDEYICGVDFKVFDIGGGTSRYWIILAVKGPNIEQLGNE